MRKSNLLVLPLLTLVLAMSNSTCKKPAPNAGATEAERAAAAAFSKWVDTYLEDFYRRHPAAASYDGIHTYDNRLDSFSPESIQAELAALAAFEKDLAGVDSARLPLSDRLDWQLAGNNIRSRRLELERIRMWQKQPDVYCSVIGGGLMLLTMQRFAPPETRLRSVIAREREIPRLLDEARANVANPPAVYVKVALEDFDGVLDFVQNDIPKAFPEVKDAALLAELRASTAAAAEALRKYIAYLKNDLRPKAKGEFAIGAENYADLLKFQEGVNLPLGDLLGIAQREIEREQERFRVTAAEIDPAAEPHLVWERLKREHPPAGHVVAEAQKQLATIIQFIEEKHLVTLPQAVPAVAMPTPPFYRQSFASMWNPGPFETADLPSPYFVTEVDPAWPRKKQEEYLTAFNYSELWSTSIHEAYPGHYVQGMIVRQAPSKVRKAALFAPNTYVEGWAHYTEQMMIAEEGFGGRDPKIRLGQIVESLLRLCRFYAGISLHTRGMSVDEATRFFMKNAFWEETPARAEAERGTYDPTYLVYSVGKLEILKLREDYRALQGDKFSLMEFHDRLLRGGQAPIWVYRRLLLGDRDDGKILY